MKISEFTQSKLFIPLILLIISVVAVILRLLPYFTCGVEFTGLPDSLYELRLTEIPFEKIDNFTADGNEISWGIFYTLILCGAKFIGILPLVPIILFVGLIILTYFIGKRINKTVGILSATLLAVMNCSLFYKSMFGGIDHHIAEVFFSTLFILCFLISLDKKHVIWYIATCLSALATMLVMTTCIVFPALLTVFAIICYFTKTNCEEVCKINIATNLFLSLSLFILKTSDTVSSYSYGSFVPIFTLLLAIINVIILIANKKIQNKWVGFGILIGGIITSVIGINLTGYGYDLLYHVTPFTQSGIAEMQPYSIYLFIGSFGLTIILMILGIISFLKIFKNKKFNTDYIFVFTWFIAMLWITICHCRWEYYFIIPAVILMGIGVWQTINYLQSSENSKGLVKLFKGFFVVCLIVSVGMCAVIGSSYLDDSKVEQNWKNIGGWLQNNTENQPYEENGLPTYRILSNWEYGHYIELWGHRCPYSNPFQANCDSENMLITGENIPKDIEYVILTNNTFSNSTYRAIQIFAQVDTPLENSAMYKVYNEGNPLYEHNGIKIFTIKEWKNILFSQ